MFKLSLAFSAALVTGQVTLTAYCDLLATKCPGHSLNSANCQTVMQNSDVGTVDEENKDSLECRYKFLNNPAFNSTGTACQYAGPTGGGRCGTVLATTCRVAQDVCGGQGTSAAYPDVNSCISGLTPVQHQWGNTYGANAAGEDSLECRAYHAIAFVLTGDAVHCGHYTNNGTQPCRGAIKPNVATYCDTLQRSCGNGTDTPNRAQFAMAAQCVATATGYPSTNADDARPANGGNTLGCRQYHSWAAAADPATHCQHAGPSGAGVCGVQRDAWASILNAAPCLDPHVDLFVKGVSSTLVDQLVPVGFPAGSNYSTTFDTDKNTQVCRIYHLGVASTLPATGPTSHCTHGAVSGGGLCGSSINNLCTFIQGACGFGTNATWQFADEAACRTALAVGTAGITLGVPKPLDTAFNTQECRFYHAGVAATFLAGGANAAVAGAASQRQLHCSHVLQKTVAGGCNPSSNAPTAAPPAAKGSASTLSAGAAMAVLFFSL